MISFIASGDALILQYHVALVLGIEVTDHFSDWYGGNGYGQGDCGEWFGDGAGDRNDGELESYATGDGEGGGTGAGDVSIVSWE